MRTLAQHSRLDVIEQPGLQAQRRLDNRRRRSLGLARLARRQDDQQLGVDLLVQPVGLTLLGRRKSVGVKQPLRPRKVQAIDQQQGQNNESQHERYCKVGPRPGSRCVGNRVDSGAAR